MSRNQVFTMEVKGIEDVVNKLSKMNMVVQTETKITLKEAGMKIQADAKRNVLVDTGRLKNSITTEIWNSGYTVTVGTNVKYAPFVEYGTRNWSGKPFLRPAYKDNADNIQRELKKILEKACK